MPEWQEVGDENDVQSSRRVEQRIDFVVENPVAVARRLFLEGRQKKDLVQPVRLIALDPLALLAAMARIGEHDRVARFGPGNDPAPGLEDRGPGGFAVEQQDDIVEPGLPEGRCDVAGIVGRAVERDQLLVLVDADHEAEGRSLERRRCANERRAQDSRP